MSHLKEQLREFMECDTCRPKPGSPTLCAGCLHNRSLISDLKEMKEKHNVEWYELGRKHVLEEKKEAVKKLEQPALTAILTKGEVNEFRDRLCYNQAISDVISILES